MKYWNAYIAILISLSTWYCYVNAQSCSCTTRWLMNTAMHSASYSANPHMMSYHSMNPWMSYSMSKYHSNAMYNSMSMPYQSNWHATPSMMYYHNSMWMSNSIRPSASYMWMSHNPHTSWNSHSMMAWHSSKSMMSWKSSHSMMAWHSSNSIMAWHNSNSMMSWKSSHYSPSHHMYSMSSMWHQHSMNVSYSNHHMMNYTMMNHMNSNSMYHISPSKHYYNPSMHYTTECVCPPMTQVHVSQSHMQHMNSDNIMPHSSPSMGMHGDFSSIGEMMSHKSITPSVNIMPSMSHDKNIIMSSHGDKIMMSSHGDKMMMSSHGDKMMMSSHGDKMIMLSYGDKMMMSSHRDKIMMSSHGDKMIMSSHGDKMMMSSHGDKMMMSSHGDKMMMSSHDGDKMMMSSHGDKMMMSSDGDKMMMSSPGDKMRISSHGDKMMMSSHGDKMRMSSHGEKIMPTKSMNINPPSNKLQPSQSHMIKPSRSVHGPMKSSVYMRNIPKNTTVLNTKLGFSFCRVLWNALRRMEKIAISMINTNIDGYLSYKSKSKEMWMMMKKHLNSTNAKVVGCDDHIRFIPKDGEHGLVTIMFSIVQTNSTYVSIDGNETYRIFLLVPPEKPKVMFRQERVPINVTSKEDGGCIFYKFDKYEFPVLPTNMSRIPNHLEHFINASTLNMYENIIKDNPSMFQPQIQISNVDSSNGLWYYKGKAGTKIKFPRNGQVTFQQNYSICFDPAQDFSGMATGLIKPILKSKNGQMHDGIESKIYWRVMGVNDRPVVLGRFYELPALQFNITGSNRTCYKISSFLSEIAKDKEGTLAGIAVIQAIESEYGFFEYKCNGSVSPMKINITNNKYNEKNVTINALFLTKDDYICFVLKNMSLYWLTRDSSHTLKYLAWDGTDNSTCGVKMINRINGENPLALSNQQGQIDQLRKDCAGKPGKVSAVDQCGVCGGRNKCFGCDGVKNSGAVFGFCKICSTDRFAGRDCAGNCNGTSFNDTLCGVCRKPGSRNLTDCNGDCFGNATISCGYCVGGKTGRALNFSRDACGVCNGNNSKCADCENVPNGGKTLDLCGVCYAPNNPLRGSSCVKAAIYQSPKTGLSDMKNNISLRIAGGDKYSNVSCRFVYNVKSWQALSTMFSWNKKMIYVLTPYLPNGKYKINCTLNGTLDIQASGYYYAVNESAMSITLIMPNVTKIETAAILQLWGENFFNTPDLKCLYGKEKRQLSVTFHNSSYITCELLKQKKSLISNVSLSFAESTLKRPSLFITHYVSIAGPRVVNANYLNSLAGIIIEFDKKIGFTSNKMSCMDFFPYNYTTFGSEHNCIIKSAKKFQISLIGGPTIALGSMTMVVSLLKVRDAEYTVHAELEQTFTIVAPKGNIKPNVVLFTPPFVGDCADIILRAIGRGGSGGRGLTYTWNVETTDSLTANETSQLQELKNKLSNSSALSRIKVTTAKFINKRLTFTVAATNFLGNTGSTNRASVTRKSTTLPDVVVSKTIVTVTTVEFELPAQASIPSCSSGTPPKFSYQWSFDKTLRIEFTSKDLNRRKLRFKKNSLFAGETYSVSLKVVTSGLSEIVEETIQITTTESALEPFIKAPTSVGFSDKLTLDASKSVDPDDSDDTSQYSWQVIAGESNELVYIDGNVYVPEAKSKIEVDASKLTAGQTYTFTVTFSKGGRVATASHSVNVVQGNPPEVIINTNANVRSNPSEKIVLKARINTVYNGKFEWSSVLPENSDGFATIDLETAKLTKISGTYSESTNARLVLKPNSLQGGLSYRFMLKVTEGSIDVTSYVTITTNSAPTAGILALSQTQGIELETDFVYNAAEGFADADGDSLVFRFGYVNADGSEVLSDSQDDTTFSQILPRGYYDVVVYCIDSHGAFSRVTAKVNVTRKIIDAAAFGSLTNNFNDLESSGNINALLTLTSTVGQAVSGDDNNNNANEIPEEQANFQRTALTAIVSINADGAIQGQNEKLSTLVAIRFSSNGARSIFTSSQIAGALNAIFNLINNPVSGSSSRRKRRAVSLPNVEAKNAAQVETGIKAFEPYIVPDQFDQDSQNAKTNLLNALDSSSQSMCKFLSPGEPAIIAKTKYVLLQVNNKQFNNVDTVPIQLGCSDCPSYRNGSDFTLLGSGFKSNYLNYECQSGEDNCTGLCVSSAQLPYDLLVSSSYPSNLTRMSDILLIKFWNPNTFVEITPVTIGSGMNVSIVVTKTTNKTYMCRRWSSGSWMDTGVYTLTKTAYTRSDGVSYVDCNVTSIGYIALFEGPEVQVEVEPSSSVHSMMSTSMMASMQSHGVVASISSSSSQHMTSSVAVTMTTTVAPQNYLRNVKFSLSHPNCAGLYKASTKSAFDADLKAKLAPKFNVTPESMKNFNSSCGSIIVIYQQGPSGSLTAEEAEALVKNAVKITSFNITIGNETLTPNANSYESSIVIPPYATTQRPPVKEDDDDLSGGAIAGIVIGVLCAFILILCLVYFLVIKKKTRKDGTVEPNDNILELRGKQNQGYDKTENNYESP